MTTDNWGTIRSGVHGTGPCTCSLENTGRSEDLDPADDQKQVLGLGIETNERSKFWPKLPTGLRSRGVQDFLSPWGMASKTSRKPRRPASSIGCATASAFEVGRDAAPFAVVLRDSYGAGGALEARAQLGSFAAGRWGRKYRPSWGPGAGPGNRTPFFAFPVEMLRVIHSTNAVERLHMPPPKIIRNHRKSPPGVWKAA